MSIGLPRKVVVYVGLVLLVPLLFMIFLVLFMNRSNQVHFWFFGLTDQTKPRNVVTLIVLTALLTLWAERIVVLGIRYARELRDLGWRGRSPNPLDPKEIDKEQRAARPVQDKEKSKP